MTSAAWHASGQSGVLADERASAERREAITEAPGLSWNDASGRHNGQYAPFSWRSA